MFQNRCLFGFLLRNKETSWPTLFVDRLAKFGTRYKAVLQEIERKYKAIEGGADFEDRGI